MKSPFSFLRLLPALLTLPLQITSYGATYIWDRDATSSARWNQVTNYTPRPPSGGPGAGDSLTLASVAPITLAGDQQIDNLSSIIAGAEIASGTGSQSTLTIHRALELDTAGATLALRSTNDMDTTSVFVRGNVNLSQGTLYLGGANSGSSLLGFTVEGITTVSSALYQHQKIVTGTALGTLRLLAGGSATLLHEAGTKNGNFSTTVAARSLSGGGTLLGSNMTGTGTRNATLHLSATAGESGTFSGALRDDNGGDATGNTLHLVVGSGVHQTLSGANSYSGTTTVSEGTLTLSGSGEINTSSSIVIENGGTLIQSSSTTLHAPIVFTSGTIGGSGTIAADLEIGAEQTLSPGNSPGSQIFDGDQQWAAGGNYNWQVLDAAGSAGSGFDTLEITGTLSLLGLSAGDTFNLNLWSLVTEEESGEALGFNIAQSYSWLIARAGTIDFDTAFDVNDLFTIHLAASNGTDGFQNAFHGTWGITLSGDGTSLYLNYTAIPEPRSLALLAGAALLALPFTRTLRRILRPTLHRTTRA